ncbi:gag-polypeptide of LTR copia-type [Phytophthora infestans]|uniref:Gag-polypeptide of LTR copia-type n=1 Tax=Phytophthora infestans TaxID=4787 RepID=A0A833WDV5_PHYIN|nr:gag-polypeptide of LTR copia-type [Phytophthora infestans]
MIRECSSAQEAWKTLRDFFVKKNLHNRVMLRKQLHEFQMAPGSDLLDHLLKFDDLCLRLSAVGDDLSDDEKLVILLGSLSSEYDAMVKIIEAHSSVTLIDAKAMLRREFETLRKRDKQEKAFNAVSQDAHVGRQGNNGRSKWPQSGIRGRGRGSGGRGSGGRGSGSRGAGGRRAGGRGGDGSQRGRGGRGGSGFSGQCFECHQA